MAGESKHFLWADIIRIVAIYLVIAVHLSFLPEKVDQGGLIYFLHFAISKTSVPLFVMISGALLLSKQERYIDFYKKRASRILAPWLIWSVIFMMLELRGFSLSSFKEAIWSFWFLPMIFCLYIITPILRKVVEVLSKADLLIVIIIWFLANSFLPYFLPSLAFPPHVDNGLLRQVVNFIGYFIAGYYLLAKGSIKPGNLVIGLGLIIIGLFIIFSSVFQVGVSTQSVIYHFDYHAPGIILLSIGIFITMSSLVIKFERQISPVIKNILSLVAPASLGVYFIHGFLWKFLQQKLLLTNQPFQNMIVSIFILFFVSLMSILLLKKIPLIGKHIA